jgi:hypothetical protein
LSKVYKFHLSSPAEKVIEKAKATAAKNGIAFKGDAASGSFSGMGVVGEYQTNDRTLQVQIKSKPLLVTWGLIEKSLKEFFASA